MTTKERALIEICLEKIAPALEPATLAHGAFLLLGAVLEDSHGAAAHAPKRGRRKKAEAPGEGEAQP